MAWLFLALAIALHVSDEALTDFLPLYNSIVESWRDSYPWLPLPTFSFSVWLTGLLLGVLVLLGLSPLVFRGDAWLRPVSYALGILMMANALGHIGASLYWGMLAPGVLSSPILLLAALATLSESGFFEINQGS
ncbi:MAG: HXXEE domain-containing protein [Gammaproteobacteria bacterium]|nr:HXXEE domain-containing protein [Gammaproteobacteria bacterium]